MKSYVNLIFLFLFYCTSGLAGTDPPGPTQPNTAKNCNKWILVKAGDTCTSVERKADITKAQFQKWNPDVSDDCTENFWKGYAYCVGVGPGPTTKTTKTKTKTTTKTSSTASTSSTSYSTRHSITSHNITTPTKGTVFPPKETQTGIPKACNDWHYVGIGDTCASIVRRYASQMTLKEL